MKWVEAFEDCMRQTVGVRMIPLYYVILPIADVPTDLPELVTDGNDAPAQPHSELYGSDELEMAFRASHDHHMFREDDQRVYFALEEETRGTIYVATIKPFQRQCQGRAAYTALKSQQSGQEKW